MISSLPSSMSSECLETISTLITASHILHYHGVVDAFGHISVRNPDNKETFFMSRNLAPALVSTLDDIVEYHVRDASPVLDEQAPKGFLERSIHAALYRRFEGVKSVVHGHAEPVVTFSILPEGSFGAVYHMAGFLGCRVPVFDIADVYKQGEQKDLLVRTSQHGDALAAKFSESHGPKKLTDHPVVLMRGHGVTIAAESIQEACYMAIYTLSNARILNQALNNRASVGREISLSEDEAADVWKANGQQTQRPWGLWVAEVAAEGRAKGLYNNALKI